MPATKDRKQAKIDEDAERAALARRRRSGASGAVMSSDKVAGAIQVLLELDRDADQEQRTSNPGPGQPRKKEQLLKLLEHLTSTRDRQGRRWKLGAVADPKRPKGWRGVGTAERGELVQTAAKALNLSPEQVKSLAIRIASIAWTLPEKIIHDE
jgi:hypothetical protein